MKKYRHIFFDLDHTLWDFETNSRATLLALFEKHGLEEPVGQGADAFYQRYVEVNNQKWEQYRQGTITKEELRAQRFHDTFCSFGYNDASFSGAFDEEYIDKCPRQTGLMPGALELLKKLYGRYQLHIITNGFAHTQTVKLAHSGLAPFFENVFSSEEIGVNKPAARIFVESLKRVGAARKESLMVGDNLQVDVVGARNCGIDQVFFNPLGVAHSEAVTYEIKQLTELQQFL